MKTINSFFKKLIFIFWLTILISCSPQPKNEVIIYTSLDQVYSEPILQDFEKKTGIKVRAVYDVESTKTTGLVNRLIAEKSHPQADVFWNSEIARTLVLKNQKILTPYFSDNAREIPQQFKDREGYWTGFSVRARVLIYNKQLLKETDLPQSIFELTQPKWKGKVTLAYPLFGTTSAQAASLFASMGDEAAEKFFRDLKSNNVIIVDGNTTSRDMVQNGTAPIGFTDSDDAHVALMNQKPVGIIYPDQGSDQIGTFVYPNTVSLIKNAPHPDNGKKLIDYLLSKDVESKLAFADCAQIPLRDDVKKPDSIRSYQHIKSMSINYKAVADKIEHTNKILQEIFVR
ncbi:MAG: extracellular solute-binding protein [Candidatus Omnitrophica bacterium]|nr:extracellular solute-binding protein [Candidatus Omnitrophota bacterium]